MNRRYAANRLLAQEARALRSRLDSVKPFALLTPMVAAAAVSPAALRAIEHYLGQGREQLHWLVSGYLDWLRSHAGQMASPAEAQRRFTILRLKFNSVLTQFDIFADVITQRSEHGTGVWLSGLDAVAADALALPGSTRTAPPVLCYLDRGHGAAIRRARTRLPGGGNNPVAIVRVPRERMVGSGIASSVVHEVGHQGAALLDLVNSLRPVLRGFQGATGQQRMAWVLWERWISEIIADFWSVARVGVASTLGLIGVVSLPRAFVFRVQLDDPHPFPWIRVKLSCAIGNALFPHSQWQTLARIWESFYPIRGLDRQRRRLIVHLESSMPGLVSLLVSHRPQRLRGASLAEVLGVAVRRPVRLSALFKTCQADLETLRRLPPTLACAVVGQARMDGRMSPEDESRILTSLLTRWALHGSQAPIGRRVVTPDRPLLAAA